MDPGFSAFVLTVEPEDGARRQAMGAELIRARFPWRFFEGITAAEPNLRNDYDPRRNLLLNNRAITNVELACYASHRAIWQQIAKGSEDAALVFEDDARITDEDAFYTALADIRDNLQHFDLVKFFDYQPKRVVLTKQVGSTMFVSHKMIASGAVSYLITKNIAQRLLNRTCLFRAVDDDWTHPWEFGMRIWSVHPNPVVTVENGTSLIDADRLASRQERTKGRSLWNIALTAHRQLKTAVYHRWLASH